MRYRPFHDASLEPPERGDTHLPDGQAPVLYEPTIAVRTNSAHRGVRLRLFGAAACGLVAAIATASVLVLNLQSFVLLIVGVIAGGCALVTITLAMSARKEEEVHQLAASLSSGALPEAPPTLSVDDTPTDGSL